MLDQTQTLHCGAALGSPDLLHKPLLHNCSCVSDIVGVQHSDMMSQTQQDQVGQRASVCFIYRVENQTFTCKVI